MNIKDGIKYASELLLMTEVSAGLAGSGTGSALDTSAARELADLLSCAHGVVREIAAEYARVLQTDSAYASMYGLISYASLSKNVVEVVDVARAGSTERFSEDVGGIKVNFYGICSVTYSYLPIINSVTDTVEFDNPKIDARVTGFGIAAEYCMREGMSDEAVLWDRRYKDALTGAKRARREQRVRKRSWI